MSEAVREFRYKKIDAFAKGGSGGNPAGYVRLEEDDRITEKEMLQIAREQKGFVNEVGFVRQRGKDSFDLKYYSSEREVDFCGHATVAIFYDLIRNDPGLAGFSELNIRTNRGVLKVYNRLCSEDAVFILSPVPEYNEKIPDLKEIAKNLGIRGSSLDRNLPVKMINAGLATLIVPVLSLEEILEIRPDLEVLKGFCLGSGIDIVEVFTPETFESGNDFRTRVFAPTFGYLEDPATGSGNSALGYYLLQLSLWKKETLILEQNGDREKFNVVKLQKTADEEGRERVLFGGGAVTRIEGRYFLSRQGE